MEKNLYNNNIQWKLILNYETNLYFLSLIQNNSEIQYSNNFSNEYLESININDHNNFKIIIESSISKMNL